MTTAACCPTCKGDIDQDCAQCGNVANITCPHCNGAVTRGDWHCVKCKKCMDDLGPSFEVWCQALRAGLLAFNVRTCIEEYRGKTLSGSETLDADKICYILISCAICCKEKHSNARKRYEARFGSKWSKEEKSFARMCIANLWNAYCGKKSEHLSAVREAEKVKVEKAIGAPNTALYSVNVSKLGVKGSGGYTRPLMLSAREKPMSEQDIAREQYLRRGVLTKKKREEHVPPADVPDDVRTASDVAKDREAKKKKKAQQESQEAKAAKQARKEKKKTQFNKLIDSSDDSSEK